MQRITGLVLLTFMTIGCQAQSVRLERAYAFFTSSIPGTQMVDENGNAVAVQPYIERFIYVECKFSGKPKVDTVYYNNNLFIATVSGKAEKLIKAGIKRSTGKSINIAAKKGNYIWRIDLQPAEGSSIKPELVKKITIKGKLNKTKFAYSINTETELATIDRY